MATKSKSKNVPSFDFGKEKKLVWAAVQAGKRTVMLSGKLMRIERVSFNVRYETGGETVKRVERWLFVKPADGSQLPCMMIELQGTSNVRT